MIELISVGSFVFGYVVWLIDEFACRYLTSARHTIGLPFAFLLELHGWYVKWLVLVWEKTDRYQVAHFHRHRRVHCRGSHRRCNDGRSDRWSNRHICLAGPACGKAHVWKIQLIKARIRSAKGIADICASRIRSDIRQMIESAVSNNNSTHLLYARENGSVPEDRKNGRSTSKGYLGVQPDPSYRASLRMIRRLLNSEWCQSD